MNAMWARPYAGDLQGFEHLVSLVDWDLGMHLCGSDEHRLLVCEWLRFHHIDPMIVPLHGEVFRCAASCSIDYIAFSYQPPCAQPDPSAIVLDGRGIAPLRAMTEQGEAPPLPFPDCPAGVGWVASMVDGVPTPHPR